MSRKRRDPSSKLKLRTETVRKLGELPESELAQAAGGTLVLVPTYLKPRGGGATAATDGYCCF